MKILIRDYMKKNKKKLKNDNKNNNEKIIMKIEVKLTRLNKYIFL